MEQHCSRSIRALPRQLERFTGFRREISFTDITPCVPLNAPVDLEIIPLSTHDEHMHLESLI